MHFVREVELGERNRLEVVGHTKVDDEVHWLFRNDSGTDFGKRICSN